MMDWIDREKIARDAGRTRALSQAQHAAVNARYPGTTIERCFKCDEPTGRAGIGEDSLYDDSGAGPFCEACWHLHNEDTAP
jgi:hypothetical protein